MNMDPIDNQPNLTAEAKAAKVKAYQESADKHRMKDNFSAARHDLEAAIAIADRPKQGHLYLRLARMHNGEGAHFISSNQLAEALDSYQKAAEPFAEAQKIAIASTGFEGSLLRKNIALQQYFNKTGIYKLDSDTLELLASTRESAVATFKEVLEEARIIVDPNEQSLSDPESGKTLSMLMHELAFLIEDRPEGEESPLSDDRRAELQQSVDLYSQAIDFREGGLKAMTFSRRLSPKYKLHGIGAAMSDLEEAVKMYIAEPDSQRLNILERDINKFLSDKTITSGQTDKLSEFLASVEQAQEQLQAAE